MPSNLYKSRYSPTHGATPLHVIEKRAKELIEWIQADDNNYSLSRFALDIGVNRQRFPEWARKSQVFNEAYQLAKQKQEWYMFDGALHQRLSSNMAKFALVNHHGWVDRTETTVKQEPLFAQISEATQKKLEQKVKSIENKVEDADLKQDS